MTSSGPYVQATDMRHMYEFSENTPTNIKYCINRTTISGIINNGSYNKFAKIVMRANMQDLLNDEQANFTLFAPKDKLIKHIPSDFIDNMDIGLARQVVLNSLLNRKINSDILSYSPASHYKNMNKNSNYITNLCNTLTINGEVNIVDMDINASNGIIHNVDNLIFTTNKIFD